MPLFASRRAGASGRRLRVAASGAALVALVACGPSSVPSAAAVPSSVGGRPLAGAKLGDPIPGLTDPELAAFERGRAQFEKVYTPSEGLGPLYNASSCASCHSTPTLGGSSELYRNFYVAMVGTAPFMSAPSPLPSPVVPSFGPAVFGGATSFSVEAGRFVIPAPVFLPVVVAQRNAVPVFGVGLFEFVNNATILANADPFDADGDGISGRVNIDFGDVGRFGVKAQANNLERFTRPPLFNQMGITSDPFLGSAGTISHSSLAAPQGTANPDAVTRDNDGVPDPEITRADLADLIAFSRFLAPPARRPFNELAERGEVVFGQIGCTSCHIPSLPSSRGPVEAYTDLLLHDMGPGLADGLQFGAPTQGGMSTADEFRTQPLWGVSLHAPYLHDGRAATLLDAVDAHGGEALASRDRFRALPAADRQALITFLEYL